MQEPTMHRAAVSLAAVIVAAATVFCVQIRSSHGEGRGPGVRPVFDLSTPAGGPFPSDRFTVADPEQNTGRRVALPMPSECTPENLSECEEVTSLNRLDGFNVTPRIAIPFDGEIDPSTATSDAVFLVSLGVTGESSVEAGLDPRVLPNTGAGKVVGIDQVVWDVETQTLHASADKMLDEHTRYALIVTRRLRDTAGNPVAPSPDFERFRRDLRETNDPDSRDYRRALLTAEWAARRSGVPNDEIAALSVFTTQSTTSLGARIVAQVRRGVTPAAVDFNIGPGGAPAAYTRDAIASLTWNQHTSTTGGTTVSPQPLAPLDIIPGAVGRVAFGRFESPDFMVHPGEHLPESPTRTGTVTLTGTNTVSLLAVLPAGAMPARGWPVVIYGHGSNRSNRDVLQAASVLASHGLAVIGPNATGCGFGPATTVRVGFADGTSATVPLAGRSFDQNGDGVIANREGDSATAPRTLQLNADAQLQTVADLTQLVRVLRAGVDIDGDGAADLDPSRIYYQGSSLGGGYGTVFFAMVPEVRAAAFDVIGAPLFENRRLDPAARGTLAGAQLGARRPSLLNSDDGLTHLDGIAVTAPLFNENLPLRGQPTVVNTVPGAIAIQQFIDRAEWIAQRGSPQAWAPRLRHAPLPGVPARPFYYQMLRGDQSSPNPNTWNILRAGNFADRASMFRYDLWWPTNQSAPKNPHPYGIQVLAPWAALRRDGQRQAGAFFASDGAELITPPELRVYWEVPPASAPPDTFGYIQ